MLRQSFEYDAGSLTSPAAMVMAGFGAKAKMKSAKKAMTRGSSVAIRFIVSHPGGLLYLEHALTVALSVLRLRYDAPQIKPRCTATKSTEGTKQIGRRPEASPDWLRFG